MAHSTISNQQTEEFPKAIFATSLILIYITADNWLFFRPHSHDLKQPGSEATAPATGTSAIVTKTHGCFRK